MEREVGGGIGMGNTCKPMADSFQCMTKSTTIKKKKFNVGLLISTSLVAQTEKRPSVYNAGDLGLIPGSGRFPGEGNGNPLQYSCLENPMDEGAWCPWGRKILQMNVLKSTTNIF